MNPYNLRCSRRIRVRLSAECIHASQKETPDSRCCNDSGDEHHAVRAPELEIGGRRTTSAGGGGKRHGATGVNRPRHSEHILACSGVEASFVMGLIDMSRDAAWILVVTGNSWDRTIGSQNGYSQHLEIACVPLGSLHQPLGRWGRDICAQRSCGDRRKLDICRRKDDGEQRQLPVRALISQCRLRNQG